MMCNKMMCDEMEAILIPPHHFCQIHQPCGVRDRQLPERRTTTVFPSAMLSSGVQSLVQSDTKLKFMSNIMLMAARLEDRQRDRK
jgi:hypothetical protein